MSEIHSTKLDQQSSLKVNFGDLEHGAANAESTPTQLRGSFSGRAMALLFLALSAAACTEELKDKDDKKNDIAGDVLGPSDAYLDSSTDTSADIGPDITPTSSTQIVCDDQHPLIDQFQGLSEALEPCKSCHVKGGLGESAWHWYGGSDPQQVQDSFDSFFDVAKKASANGHPWITQYPQKFTSKKSPGGKESWHGGGKQVLDESQTAQLTAFHDAVVDYVEKFGTEPNPPEVNTTCNDAKLAVSQPEFFQDVEMLTPADIYLKFLRSASGGELPDNPPVISNKEQLKAYLKEATNLPGFYDWLRWNFNDLTLTRFYDDEENGARNLLGKKYGIDWKQYDNGELADSVQNLLAYIVYNNRSIKELLTAPYVVVPGQKSPIFDPNENWPARLQAFTIPEAPLAGLTNDTLWLNKHPSTDTNINRHRAWLILMLFFDLNVLDIGSQNVEAPTGIKYPTLTYPACVVCHSGTPLDSVAGAFWNWQNSVFSPKAKLPDSILAMNLNGFKIPNDAPDALAQMMYLLTLDPNISLNDPDYNHDRVLPFARSMAKLAFRFLMQRETVKAPKPDEADYEAKIRRYKVENEFIGEMAQFLKDSNYNFRELIIEMATSDFYAASGKVTKALSPEREVELEHVGPGMATPEMLSIRLRQLFGDGVFKSGLLNLVLKTHVTDLGGINSKSVSKRNRDPNAAYELVIQFLAFEAAKLVVADLALEPQERHLFPYLNFGKGKMEAPIYPGTGKPIPENEIKYKQTMVRILYLAYGKVYGVDSKEVNEAYTHWLEIWQKFVDDPGSGKIADAHQVKGMDPADPYGLIRTWEAFLIEIVSGPEFNVSKNNGTEKSGVKLASKNDGNSHAQLREIQRKKDIVSWHKGKQFNRLRSAV